MTTLTYRKKLHWIHQTLKKIKIGVPSKLGQDLQRVFCRNGHTGQELQKCCKTRTHSCSFFFFLLPSLLYYAIKSTKTCPTTGNQSGVAWQTARTLRKQRKGKRKKNVVLKRMADRGNVRKQTGPGRGYLRQSVSPLRGVTEPAVSRSWLPRREEGGAASPKWGAGRRESWFWGASSVT